MLLALGTGIVLSVPVLIAAHPSAGKDLSDGASALVQFATALGFLLVPFAIAAGKGATVREAAAQLGLRRFQPSALHWMLAAIGAYLLFAIAYTAIFGSPEQEDVAEAFGAVPMQVLLIVVAAPISEEVCFRGMLFGGLRERFPRLVAALISGVDLRRPACHHRHQRRAVLAAFGFILALLYEKTGSIVPGILLHMLNNSIALLGAVAGKETARMAGRIWVMEEASNRLITVARGYQTSRPHLYPSLSRREGRSQRRGLPAGRVTNCTSTSLRALRQHLNGGRGTRTLFGRLARTSDYQTVAATSRLHPPLRRTYPGSSANQGAFALIHEELTLSSHDRPIRKNPSP